MHIHAPTYTSTTVRQKADGQFSLLCRINEPSTRQSCPGAGTKGEVVATSRVTICFCLFFHPRPTRPPRSGCVRLFPFLMRAGQNHRQREMGSFHYFGRELSSPRSDPRLTLSWEFVYMFVEVVSESERRVIKFFLSAFDSFCGDASVSVEFLWSVIPWRIGFAVKLYVK